MSTNSAAGRKRKNDQAITEPPLGASSLLEQPGGADQGTPKKKKAAPKPKKPLDSRFGGKTEEEIMQLLLPDHLKPDLDIVFIGINPGLLSAYLGHHYCNANNHFWPCMYESGLIPRKMTYKEDAECLDHGIGFTNIVPRTTRSSNDLSRKEIKEWSDIMINRMKDLRPLILCFNGKGIYEIFTGKKCDVGLQPVPLPDTTTVVYVMPSTSGRAASHPRRVDKLKFFLELKQLRDNLKAKRPITTGLSTAADNPSTVTQSGSLNTVTTTPATALPSVSTATVSMTTVPIVAIPMSTVPPPAVPPAMVYSSSAVHPPVLPVVPSIHQLQQQGLNPLIVPYLGQTSGQLPNSESGTGTGGLSTSVIVSPYFSHPKQHPN